MGTQIIFMWRIDCWEDEEKLFFYGSVQAGIWTKIAAAGIQDRCKKVLST